MQVTDEMVRVAVQAMKALEDKATEDPENIFGADLTSLARAALSAALAAMWQPIETAELDDLKVTSETFLLSHIDRKWVRFGKWYVQERCWYYSGTSERSQWAQVRGDEPTHWAPFLPAPSQLSKRDDAERDSRQEA